MFLPSDGSSSTEAVVGFVSHTTVAPRWWWTGNLCSRFMLLLARWLYGRLDLLQRWPLPVLGSLVISSPASCLALPSPLPALHLAGESSAHEISMMAASVFESKKYRAKHVRSSKIEKHKKRKLNRPPTEETNLGFEVAEK